MAGPAVYAVCQVAIVSILARLESPVMVGQYALGVAVSAPTFLLLPLNRRLYRRASDATDLRVLSLVFSLLGIAAVGFLAHSTQDRLAVLLVAMAQSVEWAADAYAGERCTWSLILHGTLSVAVLGIIVSTTGRPGAGLLGVLVARLLVLFLYDFRKTPRNKAQDSGETMFDSLAASVPCYFVAHILGYRALGIFAALASLTPIARVLVSSLGRAAAPILATSYEDGDHTAFLRMGAQLARAGLILTLCAVAAAMVFGPWVLTRLFGGDYANHTTVLVALSAAAGCGLVSLLLTYPLSAGRRSCEQLPLEIAAIAATSIACVALVPRMGIVGAALAWGFGYLVQIAGQLCVLRLTVRHPRPALLALLKEPLIH